MRRRSASLLRTFATVLSAVGLLSCTDTATAPHGITAPDAAGRDLLPNHPSLIISQIYGGGGNSGATYTNDFIEIFNPGSDPVSVAGWSVQYASAAGTTWAPTALSGTIPAGGYYLVQEAVGAGGTTPLPTPDAIGTTAMAAGGGKIILASQTVALSGSCPTGGAVIELVSFGTGNCAPSAPAP